jgi:hypothetical protein
MKTGGIYKIKQKNEELVGVILESDIKSGVSEGTVTMLTIAGEELKLRFDGSETISSPRLKPELRSILKLIYKEWAKKISLLKEKEELVREINKQREVMEENLNQLVDSSDVFTTKEFQEYYCISSYSRSKESNTFSVSVEKEIEKYASPEKYSFLYREYDGNIFLSDMEELHERFNVTIPKYKTQELELKLKFVELKKVEPTGGIGDKDTLMSGQCLTFSYKKNATRKQMLYELDIISDWVKTVKRLL